MTSIKRTLEEFDERFVNTFKFEGCDIALTDLNGKKYITAGIDETRTFIIQSHLSYLRERNERLEKGKVWNHNDEYDPSMCWTCGHNQSIQDMISLNESEIAECDELTANAKART